MHDTIRMNTRPIAHRRRGHRSERPIAIIKVMGEILLTAGVIIGLFLVWQLWLNDIFVAVERSDESSETARDWVDPGPEIPAAVYPSGDEPPVLEAPGNGQVFGILMVPRFGPDYQVRIAEGTGTQDVLNRIGIGHYKSTQMPGEVGNFAIAGHRTTYGAPFGAAGDLVAGDNIYIEVEAGWYSYAVTANEIVVPTAVQVLEPVPNRKGLVPDQRVITLTTCHPKYSARQRLIVYGIYNGWYPREGGVPTEIATTVAKR